MNKASQWHTAAPRQSRWRSASCRRTLHGYRQEKVKLTAALRDHAVALYDGEIAYVDARLGEVFEALGPVDGPRPTLTVLTSDHGELLFDDPDERVVGHGTRSSDPVLRVPLIVHDPRNASAPRRVDSMVGLIDLAPTILDLVDLRVPKSFAGRSLARLARTGTERTTRTEIHACTMGEGARLTLREERRKIVCNVRMGHWICELYDLEADPREWDNVIGDRTYAGDARRLESSLRSWWRETADESRLRKIGDRDARARR